MSVSIRRARPDDADFLLELTTHEDVDPYLSARRATTREELLEEIQRSEREPERFGRFVVEVDGRRAGAMGFTVANERSRIAQLGGLAIHPDFRGRRLSDEAARLLQRDLLLKLGYHRLQLEIYGFNERAMRHAERAGFVREGVRRKAYRRHGRWVDGVLYGLIREDLESQATGEDEVESDEQVEHEAQIQDPAQEWDELRELERMPSAPGDTNPEGDEAEY